MAFQNINTPTGVVDLLKNLAKSTGAAVLNNRPDTTPLIANNGNTYEG